MMMKQVQKGFTLIELMIVVTIIGILSAIAVPAYQDFTVRAKVTEVINAVSACKTGVEEAYQSSGGTFPATLAAAGCATVQSKYVASVRMPAAGQITVTASGNLGGSPTANGRTITFVAQAATAGGGVDWTCTSGNMPAKYRPANCR